MNDFEQAHQAFIEDHLSKRNGERKNRLERGHNHAEKLFTKNVWWKLKGHFSQLHPEYEVIDWRGRPYFADFVYSPKLWRLLIEIKGFRTHVEEMDREKFCNELKRETFLYGMGYHVVSFAYDDVATRPDLCIYLLRTILSRFETASANAERIYFADKEIIRLAAFLARPVKPIEIARYFSIDHRTAIRHLQRLCEKGWLQPVVRETGQRVMSYNLTKEGLESGLL
ncbi:hypothetical protein M6D81_15015 [Paenibacillus sp. J5C_2022]|uniref:hypothetical protein n=1 Tax=Paenibacillus sp. J5C2022 TaxID=2977129 RepID=UPI0021D021F7|nr:hypothetical protein [Paenibacillus sp. J5C2022]MCU6710005.1 hypothetical protein [Paenibacillus sp. J5C2022]